MAKHRQKKTKEDSSLGWLLVGAGVGVGLYFLFKPKITSGQTATLPVPGLAPPAGFANLGAVRSRFDDLRDLYHMDKVKAEEVVVQLDAMKRAVADLTDRGVGDAAGAHQLTADLDDFKAKVQDFMDFQQSLEVQ